MNVLEKILEEIEEKFKTADAEKFDCEELCDVEDWYDSGYIDGQLSAHEKCMDIIRSHMGHGKGTNVLSNNGWIPVEEQLPEEEKEVLAQFVVRVVHTNNTVDEEVYIHPLYYKNGAWQSFNGVPNGKVEAWQNLPEPYKPDEN